MNNNNKTNRNILSTLIYGSLLMAAAANIYAPPKLEEMPNQTQTEMQIVSTVLANTTQTVVQEKVEQLKNDEETLEARVRRLEGELAAARNALTNEKINLLGELTAARNANTDLQEEYMAERNVLTNEKINLLGELTAARNANTDLQEEYMAERNVLTNEKINLLGELMAALNANTDLQKKYMAERNALTNEKINLQEKYMAERNANTDLQKKYMAERNALTNEKINLLQELTAALNANTDMHHSQHDLILILNWASQKAEELRLFLSAMLARNVPEDPEGLWEALREALTTRRITITITNQ